MTVTLKVTHVGGSRPVVFQRQAALWVELQPGQTKEVTVWAGDGKLEIVEPSDAVPTVPTVMGGIPVDDGTKMHLGLYPDPTPEDLKDPEFNCIWETIKKWDIDRGLGSSRAGATGNDVMHILRELRALRQIS